MFEAGLATIFTFIRTYRDEINALSTLSIAIFTVILAFATAFLYKSTKDLVDDTKKSGQLQLRAYIVPRVTYVAAESGQPLIQIACANIGQTAALHVRVFAKIDLLPFPSTRDVLPTVTDTNQPEIFIQPKDVNDFPVRPTKPFNASDIEQIHSPTNQRLYIFGQIDYVDVFAGTHQTPFSWTISGGKIMRDILNGTGSTNGPGPRC